VRKKGTGLGLLQEESLQGKKGGVRKRGKKMTGSRKKADNEKA